MEQQQKASQELDITLASQPPDQADTGGSGFGTQTDFGDKTSSKAEPETPDEGSGFGTQTDSGKRTDGTD